MVVKRIKINSLCVYLLGIFLFCSNAHADRVDFSIARFDSIRGNVSKPEEITREWILLSARMALGYMDEALARVQDPILNSKIRRSRNAFQNAIIDWPLNDEENMQCLESENSAAYVPLGTRVVNLCKTGFLKFANGSSKRMAQIFIHEATHLWQKEHLDTLRTEAERRQYKKKESIECEATFVELAIAQNSSLEVQFKSAYWPMCGIEK